MHGHRTLRYSEYQQHFVVASNSESAWFSHCHCVSKLLLGHHLFASRYRAPGKHCNRELFYQSRGKRARLNAFHCQGRYAGIAGRSTGSLTPCASRCSPEHRSPEHPPKFWTARPDGYASLKKLIQCTADPRRESAVFQSFSVDHWMAMHH